MPANYANYGDSGDNGDNDAGDINVETKLDELKEEEQLTSLNNSNTNNKTALIFTEIEKTVDKQLMDQKKFIVESIMKEISVEKDEWMAEIPLKLSHF